MKDQWWEARNPPATSNGLSFQDNTVLVTGANSGPGYQAAIKYAALGAPPLILDVRLTETAKQRKRLSNKKQDFPTKLSVWRLIYQLLRLSKNLLGAWTNEYRSSM
ncbi:hypothetical protein F4813DRAFT_341980 [Daldinia decipiens]|uniref:uncharacterized protein n=1 Tax=Daldinia decipiens TaxID=326647 RepID=UPI0020C44C93|nr:uncharacterized protein F4813DRAFT_341980 [Daldinia decipiens]KAI1662801.1 hypothetical protein F4813DRAFT_341980 [Daldinia decipiens]